MNEDQLARLRRKAEAGNTDAAYRIGMYIAWFPKTAIENYGFRELDDIYWLRKAADQGHEEALQYLDVLENGGEPG
ncbi:hypothetical protein [Novipirellula artificiosorum]|nr:hypothetical protein [Novipirellula artificiosorum]